MRPRLSLSCLPLLAICIGCSTTGTPGSSWNLLGTSFKSQTPKIPTRIVAIWSHDVLNTPGKLPTQGFGGRIYFYDENNVAVPIEGTLTIHGYDDSAGPSRLGKYPDKKFVFTPEQLKRHYGESELGASYSIWIPWQPMGGAQKQVSLVPTFKASTGNLVVGHQTQNLLPGKKTDPAAVAKQDAPNAVYAQREASPSPPATTAKPSGAGVHEPGVTTTTINVSRSITQQLQNSQLRPPVAAPHPHTQPLQPGAVVPSSTSVPTQANVSPATFTPQSLAPANQAYPPEQRATRFKRPSALDRSAPRTSTIAPAGYSQPGQLIR